MRETNFMARTQNHIDRVRELLTVFELRINKRARNHDQSKLLTQNKNYSRNTKINFSR